jgi:hypothetical protein
MSVALAGTCKFRLRSPPSARGPEALERVFAQPLHSVAEDLFGAKRGAKRGANVLRSGRASADSQQRSAEVSRMPGDVARHPETARVCLGVKGSRVQIPPSRLVTSVFRTQ